MRKRIVLDANIYVSALIKSDSPPGDVLRYIITDTSCELVISDEILDEFKRVIFYPKVRKYIKRSDQEIFIWISALQVNAFLINNQFSAYESIVKEDPDDDKYVIAALESNAKFLITGDNHLLKLKSYGPIKIVTSKEFKQLMNIT